MVVDCDHRAKVLIPLSTVQPKLGLIRRIFVLDDEVKVDAATLTLSNLDIG